MSVKQTLPVMEKMVSYDEYGQPIEQLKELGKIDIIIVPKTDEKDYQLGYKEVYYLGITDAKFVRRNMLVGQLLVESAIDLAGKKYKLILKEVRSS